MSKIQVVGATGPDGQPIKPRNPWEAANLSRDVQKKLQSSVKHYELAQSVHAAMMPALRRVSGELQSTNFSLLAIIEVLIDKGILTADEVTAKEEAIFDRIEAANMVKHVDITGCASCGKDHTGLAVGTQDEREMTFCPETKAVVFINSTPSGSTEILTGGDGPESEEEMVNRPTEVAA